MKKFALLLLVLLIPSASALSFLEDFESFNLGGFNPDVTPDQDWYTYSETSGTGELQDDDPISGTISFDMFGATGATSASVFRLAGPTQLTNITFDLRGSTITDSGVGSRQYVQIESQAPHRTMVEFYVFCTDAGNPDACEFRVRWEQVDSKGQVLINTTVGTKLFTVTVLPDWTTGTFQLFVNGNDDGEFPFMQLPSNVGRLRIAQDSTAYPLNATLDDFFIDGAINVTATEGSDWTTGISNFLVDINFTDPTSLFLFGIILLIVLVAGVVVPLLALGQDNTVIPAVSFFAGLAVLWLVLMEIWPDWVGIALIILTSALISLVIRQLLMGIKDASTSAGIVAGSLGYFIIATSLLGFSGYATDDIKIPSSSLDTPADVDAQTNESADRQSFAGGVTECLITFFSDCSRDTVSTTWATITSVASTIFNFARTAFTFLFQLLTFQLPIPTIFNVMIVLPPAAALATVGFGFITRSGS